MLLILPAAAQAAAPQTTTHRADLPLRTTAEAERRSGTSCGTQKLLTAAAAELRLHLVREGREARQTPRLLLLWEAQ